MTFKCSDLKLTLCFSPAQLRSDCWRQRGDVWGGIGTQEQGSGLLPAGTSQGPILNLLIWDDIIGLETLLLESEKHTLNSRADQPIEPACQLTAQYHR